MKTLKLLAIGIILLVSSSIQAQVSVNLNIEQLQPGVLQDMHSSRILLIYRTYKPIMTLDPYLYILKWKMGEIKILTKTI
jgi:hypothetical protein